MIAVYFIALVGLLLYTADAGTSIKVTNNFNKELNIKIQGTGIGGCDIILQAGQEDVSDCWCLWGTINYSFCAYKKSMGGERDFNSTAVTKEIVQAGKCPMVTGETLVCSDLSSLGNCYDKSYACTINEGGLCHCDSV